MNRFTALRAWAGDTAIRALKTGAQTMVAALGASSAGVLPSTLTLAADLKLAGLAVAACVLHNVVGMPNPWASNGSADPGSVSLSVAPDTSSFVAALGTALNGTAHAGGEQPAGPTAAATAEPAAAAPTFSLVPQTPGQS